MQAKFWIGVVTLYFALLVYAARDIYTRAGWASMFALILRIVEIKRHSNTAVVLLYLVIFLACAIHLCLPIWDQLDRRTRVAYEQDGRFAWLLRLDGLPPKKKVFRVNMHTFAGGLLFAAFSLWFLWQDIVLGVDPGVK